ncbi:MAG: dihydropteroate synthase [Acidobacteriota bacterium]|nr:MAG: dihydropteroate synthase [Acidobacteriota bacterium]
MGILNVTPDSFSDGGLFATPPRALRHAAEMAEQGAEIVDVGGESTRPGAEAVPVEEECRRVLPVIEAIQRERLGIRVSIDTRRADVAARALDAGADMVNDVSGLGDPQMLPLVAARGCPIVIMHMRGRPRDMQLDTRYVDLVGEILAALGERADQARRATMTDDRIVIDPGIGFGKSATGNEEILRQLGSIRTLGLPIMIGVSRKSFIGHRTGIRNPGQRLSGSLAAATAAVLAGACLVRAHDVGATRQALDVADALRPWVESTYTAEAG